MRNRKMKIMLISELVNSKEKLNKFLGENSFELIHYRSPIKALDNIEEITPDAVIINALDFPRHWKVITQYIRWDTTKEHIIIILLSNKKIIENDANKAVIAGVQGIIQAEHNNFSDIVPELKNIFIRYGYGNKGNAEKDFSKQVTFLFTNPLNEVIITGTVKNITPTGILFLPDMPANTAELTENTILEQCSLKIGKKIIVPMCKIKSNTLMLNLEFIDLNKQDLDEITYFINTL